MGRQALKLDKSASQFPFRTRKLSPSVPRVLLGSLGGGVGIGFVEMPNKDEADKAIAALNGKDLKGRTRTVNDARPRTDKPRIGGGGFGGGRGGSRGGFGGGGKRF
jgi:hypothetical protein